VPKLVVCFPLCTFAKMSRGTTDVSSISNGTSALLSFQVERGWFQQVFLGADVPDLYDRSADEDADFNDVDQADPAEVFAAFEAECAVARQVVAQAPNLDVLSKQASERTGQPWSLRWIVTHMIEEYARHNGHADLLRERIDGSTGYY
jgi:Protein of unknown function (DUF664)